ncbi:PhoX family phosphatase [Limnohabitans sp. Rim8]|uniref:PhoX family protein n=1 Tax=Limnohabitans sp. Rim8 TaxID=1100718 RepID=UPI0025DFB9B4|nr:PhoX family phosphatase [Limnohabitans sp. Rim8]
MTIQDSNSPKHFNDVLQSAMSDPSRRQILRGGLGLSALSFLGLAGCGGSSAVSAPAKALNFSATPLNQTYDGVSVASGYKAEVLYKLGDPINATTPAYLNNGTETSASFDFRSGDHHDGMYFFGMGSNNKWSKTVSDKGLLCINHEAITPLFLHASGPTIVNSARTVADEVQKEFRLHGVSVVEVNKVNGAFQVNTASTFNRRITTLTEMDIAGPLRGHNLLKTKYSPTGVKTRGTVNNCASGYTPWGTYLACEENYAGYFKRSNTAGRSANELASEARNGVTSSSGRERWSSIVDNTTDDYARWDVTVKGASAADDYRNAANTYGFNVEIDPFAPTSTPKKRTAMGRFAHEGAWVGPVTVGKPVVFYMGCDSRNEYIYKYVSTALWVASDVNGGLAAGDKYLDDGKLYVARFNSDFSGEWLELGNLVGTQAVGSETFTFGDTSDPYLNTRLAADKKGATKMDRPEWGAVNPANGEVYMTLTNNSQRSVSLTDAANPRSYKDNASSTSTGNANGHIIRWRETGSNPAATTFTWDIYVFGAESDDLSNKDVNLSGLTADNFLSAPDGLWFSEKTGILYIQTDDGAFTNEADGKGSTCMLLAAIPGTVGDGTTVDVTNTLGTTTKKVTTKVGKTGELKRLLTGPIEAEITGITESYDGKTLFINIQHPGEDTEAANIASPTSSWPYSNTGSGNPATATTAKSARPRSATIVLTRIDGGVIGGDFSLS